MTLRLIRILVHISNISTVFFLKNMFFFTTTQVCSQALEMSTHFDERHQIRQGFDVVADVEIIGHLPANFQNGIDRWHFRFRFQRESRDSWLSAYGNEVIELYLVKYI